MALRGRHNWIASRIEDAFTLPDGDARPFCRTHIARLNEFLQTADDRLFVFFQPPMKQVTVSRGLVRLWHSAGADRTQALPFPPVVLGEATAAVAEKTAAAMGRLAVCWRHP